MRTLILSFSILLFIGCESAYKSDEDKRNKMISMAFKDGFEFGLRAGKSYCQDSGKVQTITFKYDSIMIINFDSSEIK